MGDELEGGPGGEEKEEKKEEKKEESFGTEINVGGQKFVVDKHLADAFNAQSDSYNQQFQDFQRQTSEQIQNLKPKEEKKESDEDVWLVNPAQAAQQMEDRIVTKLTSAYQTTEQQKNSRNAFWNSFYKDNEDLKSMEFMVNAVLNRDTDLLDMNPDRAKKELSERTRKELLNVIPKDKHNENQVKVEGASTPKPKTLPKEEKGGELVKLGDVIKMRRKARREARTQRLKA
jgi:hypothetical protein